VSPAATAPWRNWAGTASANPARVVAPGSVDELCAAVAAATRDRLRVKATGSGHSFTDIAVTDGVRLDLNRLDAVTAVDGTSVTVQAGIPLHRLNAVLDGHRLALTNLGDIDRQTISGAISTGTHGTGARFGGLATQVTALELVQPDGRLLRCDAGRDPDLFAAARVGLGALGVIATVTLQAEPAFLLHADERPMRLGPVLEQLDGAGGMVEANDHVEFYWFPHTDRTLTKRNNRVAPGEQPRPLGRARAWLDDELLANRVYEAVQRFGARAPATVPAINTVSAMALSARRYVDRSHRVFVSPRRVVFREMEYAVPRAAVADVLRELRCWVDGHDERISFPVEVRFAAADDIWLSTAYQRDSAYVAVHQYHRQPHERWFAAVETIMSAVGGRPHWGKLHGLDAAALAARYPRHADFVRLRDQVDPTGVFHNAYLGRVLGPPPSLER
jgi:L-gulonolactone oxidase